MQKSSVELKLAIEPIELMYVKDVAKAFIHTARYDGPLEPIYNLTAFEHLSIVETDRICPLSMKCLYIVGQPSPACEASAEALTCPSSRSRHHRHSHSSKSLYSEAPHSLPSRKTLDR